MPLCEVVNVLTMKEAKHKNAHIHTLIWSLINVMIREILHSRLAASWRQELLVFMTLIYRKPKDRITAAVFPIQTNRSSCWRLTCTQT